MFRILAAALCLSLLATSCQSTRYRVYEAFGVHKRDMLKKNVEKARDQQQDASEQFSSALETLRSIYGDSGSELEEKYDKLKKMYDASRSEADDVKDRVDEMDRVAKDLFAEWESELEQITNSRLRADSQSKLRDTRMRYADLSESMHESIRRMQPIITQLNDQVLYLKHNLNAQALGTLQGEAAGIQDDIQRLIREMNQAITEANSFIDQL